ncbi:MAG: B12-binding domain-containing radical SAM protein [Acutalibacteraceae bacterium]
MKKKVYLIQPSNILSGSVFLPYSVGAIAAYSWQFESIKEEFELQPFIFTKKPVDEAMREIDNPCIVGFSNYMWNVEYNLLLAAGVKKAWPECIIAFGGPQIADDVGFLEEYPFIDILMYGEGEESFYKILTSISSGEGFEGIDNIAFKSAGEIIKTKKSPACDISGYPSPYTSGYFDSIIHNKAYDGIQFDAIIETNRGCPYKCIYCAWSGVDSTIRQFPTQKVEAELEWLAKNKIAYCICGDANFGILERDEEIVDYLVSLKKQYGYPQKFETTAAKNKDELTFRINSKLDSVGLNKGVSVACQSLSPQVLRNVGRHNMSIDSFISQLKRYREAGMHTYTDLILGLPGETFESFCRGLFAVIEAGQCFSININRCELLPNSLMNSQEIISKYKA